MMKIILWICLMIFSTEKTKCQHILLDEKWRPKINQALQFIQQYEPAIFKTIETSYIQAGEIRCKQMNAFAQKEYRYQMEIPWIMIDYKTLDEFSIKSLASLVIHEGLHLYLWDHGNGRDWGQLSDQEQKNEHRYIYNYQIAFLKKINASKSDIYYYETLMNQIGIK